MTGGQIKRARRETVALSRAQVESILHDMGLEDEDVVSFWRLARRETRDPGCLDRERRVYFQRMLGL